VKRGSDSKYREDRWLTVSIDTLLPQHPKIICPQLSYKHLIDPNNGASPSGFFYHHGDELLLLSKIKE
jgi:hypothetical protein